MQAKGFLSTILEKTKPKEHGSLNTSIHFNLGNKVYSFVVENGGAKVLDRLEMPKQG